MLVGLQLPTRHQRAHRGIKCHQRHCVTGYLTISYNISHLIARPILANCSLLCVHMQILGQLSDPRSIRNTSNNGRVVKTLTQVWAVRPTIDLRNEHSTKVHFTMFWKCNLYSNVKSSLYFEMIIF